MLNLQKMLKALCCMNKMRKKNNKCAICKKEITGYAHNAEPVKKGECCLNCNTRYVVPARMRQAGWYV
jgi:hypothetical protein